MAPDHAAVEAEKNSAARLAGIHALAQFPERRAREQVADPRPERTRHRALEIFSHLPGGAFGRLERNVAGKAFGDDDVDLALADIVAFDKTVIIEAGQFLLAKDGGRLAHRLEALGLFDADIEQTDARAIEAEQDARHGGAHHRQIDEVVGVRTDRGAEIEHDGFTAQGRPQRRDRRALDARQGFEIELRHRHQRASIAARYRDVRVALLDSVDGAPLR